MKKGIRDSSVSLSLQDSQSGVVVKDTRLETGRFRHGSQLDDFRPVILSLRKKVRANYFTQGNYVDFSMYLTEEKTDLNSYTPTKRGMGRFPE